MKKAKRGRSRNNARLIRGAVVIAILLLMMLWQTLNRVDFSNLSDRDLVNAGFYTYIVPVEFESLHIRKMSMISFDYHCIHDMDSRDDRWNYVHVRYLDGENFPLLSIRISPNDALFDNAIAMPIQISSEYFDGVALYYEAYGFRNILMIDKNDLEVVVSSALTMEDTISYAESLIPIGKYGNENPWTQCN